MDVSTQRDWNGKQGYGGLRILTMDLSQGHTPAPTLEAAPSWAFPTGTTSLFTLDTVATTFVDIILTSPLYLVRAPGKLGSDVHKKEKDIMCGITVIA